MAQFKELRPTDVSTSKLSSLQTIAIPQAAISSSLNRRKYDAFMTGGIGPGVTSSLFQTVHDADWRLSSANPVFDMTVGLFTGSETVLSCSTGLDAVGNYIFPTQSLMMQEKIDIYRQYAQVLLGDSRKQFVAPFDSTTATDGIDEAVFMSFKRRFTRDAFQGDTGILQVYASGSATPAPINVTSTNGLSYLTDIGTNATWLYGGEVGNVINAANINNTVGLFFYDHGTIVLDAKKILSGSQAVTGAISALSTSGIAVIGGAHGATPNAAVIPDLFVSASVDDIVDCFASTRFGSSTVTVGFTAQNKTYVNASVYNCRAMADEFNYSLNPTFSDPSGRIVVIEDPGPSGNQRTFSFITSVGLYDANDNLLAVAKLSKPYYKDDTTDVTFRVRLNM
jgi:hypothetical protein